MTIYNAAQIKEELISAMAQGVNSHQGIEINLGQVSEIDAAGLQLLALVKREAAEKKLALQFVAHSKAVMEMLDLCNLAGVFGDPVVISPV